MATLAAATGSFAQSSVTLYGVADLGYNTVKLSDGTDTVKQSGLNSIASGSRFGFKGTEDLGGGLKANFLMEYSVQPDEATTSMANRQSYVGLEGDFGSVNLGRQYTLHHGVQGGADLIGNVTAAGWIGGMDSRVRQSNAITYKTPTFNGFSASAQVGFGESVQLNGSAKENEQTSLGLNYANGPLALAYAYEKVKNTSVLARDLAGTAFDVAAIAGADSWKANALSASYDFGVAKVAYLNNSTKADDTTFNAKFAANNFAVSVPFGSFTALATVGNGKIKVDGVDDTKLSAYQLGLTYALSKRTTAYSYIGETKFKDVSVTPNETIKYSTTAVGVRHTF
ncbi:porin [Limnohabitans sp. G3-2]|uniref:porin n=1 Tax=Limnohabitans sp. G3-2 TaxID=1100711 RepID=UPI002101C875|nr:porin [Limnohabitans sp. G3-2]